MGALAACAPGQPRGTSQDVEAIVAVHRQVVVVSAEAEAAAEPEKGRLVSAARSLAARRDDLTGTLVERVGEVLRASAADAQAAVEDLIRRIEGPDVLEADRLAFAGVLEDLRAEVEALGLDAVVPLVDAALGRIESRRAELDREAGTLPRGGAAERPQWDAYLRALRQELDARRILADEPIPDESAARGAHPAETTGRELVAPTIILTFDDGPHRTHTARIMQTLDEFGVRAAFFQVGRRFGGASSSLADVTRTLSTAGHVVANHSFSHRQLPRLGRDEQWREVEDTNALLAAINGESPTLFRPPYGSRSPELLDRLQVGRMQSIMWNIDSMDWSDPVPETIVQRVLAESRAERRGIVLFHDIHQQTVIALPRLLRAWREAGFQFGSPRDLLEPESRARD